MDEIVAEAELLAARGVKEIILIAQDTTFYGLDLYKKQRIVELLQRLEEIPGIEWIRLHYAYPTTFQDELIRWEVPPLCIMLICRSNTSPIICCR